MVSSNESCWAQLVSVFFQGCWIDGDLQTVLLGGLKRQMSKACIDRSDSRRPRVIGFTYASSEVHYRSTESQTFFIGQLWQLMTASNVVARTQAWQAKWVVFKIPGFVCKRPFFPTPSLLFYVRHFSRSLWLSFLVLCCLNSRKCLLRRLGWPPNQQKPETGFKKV